MARRCPPRGGAPCSRSRVAAPPLLAVTSRRAAIVAIYASLTTRAATKVAQSARVSRAPNGSRTVRPNCSTCPTSTLCSRCPSRSRSSPSRTRPLPTIAADPKHLGAEIGFLGVLHTWGQSLQHHPHVHFLAPGGGIAPDGASW